MNTKTIILWITKIVVAAILLQTLYFKFTAHHDSIYIFEKTGLGAAGRIGSGVAELIVAILILIPKTAWLGGLGAIGMMTGAIFFHLTSLGTEVNNDGGLLFRLALIVFVGGIYIVLRHKEDIPLFKKK